MKRSAIGLLVLLALLAAPLVAPAQEPGPGKVPRVGLLTDFSMAGATTQLDPFYRTLRELGWVEGQNFTFEHRYGAGKNEALPGLAGDLVSLRVNVIVTIGTPATRAAKNATETIPIVFARVGDPVGFGFVRSLARPDGNLTGVSVLNVELGAKRLELLREAIPRLTRVGVLWDPSFTPAQPELREIEAATRSLSVRIQPVAVQRPEEFEHALLMMKRQRADAILVVGGLLFSEHQKRLADLAVRMRDLVQAGGLLSYAPSFPDMYRRAATYVDKILKGAKPADLPVEQPTKFDLVINLKTAKALGLTIPPSVLARADEVIQ
jgi:putative ABC transport system substrate-binding protein